MEIKHNSKVRMYTEINHWIEFIESQNDCFFIGPH